MDSSPHQIPAHGRVFVAMSGGVDSSVTAALLAREGHDVTGVTLALLPDDDVPGAPCGSAGTTEAQRACDTLGIPHLTLDAREVFASEVTGPFADAYAVGETPSPCVVCNDRVKFGWLLARALQEGATALATGHYARIVERLDGSAVARGADPDKDQSYFLYRLTPDTLAHVLFPLGEMRKTQVRALATEFGLSNARRAESQETCFAQDGEHTALVGAAHPGALTPGAFVTEDGIEIGRHAGVARYTIGQRKGLGLAGGPWFVLQIDPAANTVTVGPRERLAVTQLVLRDVVWPHGPGTVACAVAVRYRMTPVPAIVELLEDGELQVTFERPVEAAAPGQSAVAYDGDVVLGGGVIARAE